jgi:hypothetical protein
MTVCALNDLTVDRRIGAHTSNEIGIPMATWAEVKKYVTSKYTINDSSADLIQMTFSDGNGRSQMVFVGGDDTVVFIKSPFAKIGEVQPGKIFENTGIFGVTVVGELYCLTHTMLTPTLDALELDVPLALLVTEADQLEKALGLGDKF